MKLPMYRLASLLCASAFGLLAQTQNGTISGTVTDAQDAVVSGAKIEIKNLGTNATFRTQSNDSG